jgi:uncharacterized protein YyaL (SSP411 family)
MPNRLANENSPYLLQHSDNPVEWYPWGEEALERARREDKPIFLSIGYAACHWCHVMEHESFEDPDTAALMNEHFINIKVDREERPDLDSIYMQAVVALTGQGGWPMSVFLTPEGQPFYGGTYYPPTRRYGMPSFREVLTGIYQAWEGDKLKVRHSGEEITAHLQSLARHDLASHPLSKGALDQAALNLAQTYDWAHGGWGSAPKFPQAMAIDFLLRRAAVGDKFALEIAVHALEAMAKGGLYDVVGGGFARYSTDDHWLVPHFEKMLYDNALLALAYLHAHLLTGNAAFRRVCEETLDFITRELRHPQGGFYSSLDADSEGEEGKYYLWTPDEIRQALTEGGEAEFAFAAYGVTAAGNFEGKTVLQRALDDERLAERYSLSAEEIPGRLASIHARLLANREKRVRPATDDKVLVSWNALALVAFSEAARYLNRPDYYELATRNARFLLDELRENDKLLRSWRAGRARHNAYSEDYAGLALALLSLYQTDFDPAWFAASQELLVSLIEHFSDPAGGFFDTRTDHGPLVTRPKDLEDNATPAGNSLAALALLHMHALTGDGRWREQAERSLTQLISAAARYPTAFGNWLCAMDFALATVHEVAILGPQGDPETDRLISILWEVYRPHLVAASADFPPPPGAPPLLNDRPLLEGRPTAYVCRRFVCQRPVNQVEALREQLAQTLPGA